MNKVLAVLGTFFGTAAVSALLWNWWAPRCGDNCPTPSMVHMLVFLALLPSLGTMAAALLCRWAARPRSSGASRACWRWSPWWSARSCPACRTPEG